MNTIYTHTATLAGDDRLLPARDAARELGICVSLFWRLNRTGELPPAIYVTAKTPRWRRSELFAAMEARRTGRHPYSNRGQANEKA
jgi:predicted DNA-binding transcriptional regulator AlpA